MAYIYGWSRTQVESARCEMDAADAGMSVLAQSASGQHGHLWHRELGEEGGGIARGSRLLMARRTDVRFHVQQ